jgi:GAF domain-containing protein/HAMP domain-containing protein
MNQHPPSPDKKLRLSTSSWFANLSLRTKLIFGIILITLLAVTAMGYYGYSRAQVVSNILSTQLSQSVEQEAESTLAVIITQHSTAINSFFSSAEVLAQTLGGASENMLYEEYPQSGAFSWDARLNLTQLESGSWDNQNSDKGSVFIPAQSVLSDALVLELNTLKRLDLIAPALLEENPDALAIYFGGLNGETLYYPNIDLAAVVPPDFDVTQRPWFTIAAPSSNADRNVVWSVPYVDATINELVITTSIPVYDNSNTFRGVVAADIQLTDITEIISGIKLKETGYAFLIDQDMRVIALPQPGMVDLGITESDLAAVDGIPPSIINKVPLEVFESLAKMTTGQSGIRTFTVNGIEKFIIYRPILKGRYSLAIVVPVVEMKRTIITTANRLAQEARTTVLSVIGVLGLILLGTVIASLLIGNQLTNPLTKLTSTAKDVARGNLDAEAEVTSRDEIGTLASTLNSMTYSLRDMITSLEERVEDRTKELRERANQLRAVSEVARDAASLREPATLLPGITELISGRFGYYHVGIFLVEESDKTLYLVAANSTGGQHMLARKHSLSMEASSLVGYVALFREPRIALDVDLDSVYFRNPDLPETRSEMALPLLFGDRLIGVLDIQSRETGAFTQDDIDVLKTLVDQVAVAIENSRLLAQTRQALLSTEQSYSQYVSAQWAKYTAYRDMAGYRYDAGKTTPIEKSRDGKEKAEGIPAVGSGMSFSIPVVVQNRLIGKLDIRSKSSSRTWTADEVALIKAAAERAALALENARLLEESQMRATKERTISTISTKISNLINIENIVQTAIQELSRTMPEAEVAIQFETDETKD